MSTKLTIAVTTYNRPDSVAEAVWSVCSQVESCNEVIVVDDGSEDGLPERMFERMGECPPEVVIHQENMGLAAARNTAINRASGDYFSFCDDDDQWPAGLASSLIGAMESAPEDVGIAIALSKERRRRCGHLFEGYPRLTELMKRGVTPPNGSQMYRTELLRQVGGYRVEVTSGIDHDLWISLARLDPRVAVAWSEPAIVGNCASRERMTTVEDRRRVGIDNSLVIWRDDLCEVFGEAFYRHFVKSYQQYLDYSFFVKSIQKGEYLDAARRALHVPWLSVEIFRRRWDRLRGRPQCTLFPEYRGD